MIYVVGSGPAGMSCAAALLGRGCEVTLLDGGIELEPEGRERLARMQRLDPGAWTAADVAAIRDAQPVTAGEVPLKHVHGSDYPYRDVDGCLPFDNRGTATRPTLARGGFSTVWGAAVAPYRDVDLAPDWPLSADDLAPYYRAVLAELPLSAVRDDLEPLLPLHCDDPQPLEPSAQACALLADCGNSRVALERAGFAWGRARLAVRSGAAAAGPGCVYCGLCLHGCPHELIYNAAADLERLAARGLRYSGDSIVERVDERGAGVELRVRPRAGGPARTLAAERVYLAAGALGTTRILLESLEAADHTLTLKDSQYWLLPWVRWYRAGRPERESLHTLCQVFLELCDPALDPRTVHMQVYGWNDLYRKAIRSIAGGALTAAARPLISALVGRLLVIQGYLHSDHSPGIDVTLRRERAGSATLVLEPRPNPATRRAVRRVVARLWSCRDSFRAHPLPPLLRVAPPGRGFHSGGSFPMRRRPGPFESDRLGRPHGFERVHAVDATVFPSIPATTITLSVMANARRIAEQSA